MARQITPLLLQANLLSAWLNLYGKTFRIPWNEPIENQTKTFIIIIIIFIPVLYPVCRTPLSVVSTMNI